ncbi:ABC transporter permease [Kitasatospora sp. NPDC048540]|uniref:ABC transporter permease n=1 Tax=unclassified Kitasatospora TaxID=2633591 RepID=UPI0009EA8EA7|nr:ABC transporter permease [Kitasatospora sp. MBT63]
MSANQPAPSNTSAAGGEAVAALATATAGAPQPPAAVRKRTSRGKLTARRFARNKLALVGLGILALLFLAAYVGPSFTKYDYKFHDYMAFNAPPGGDHWWGTNQGGQDLFALTMRGLQKSLVIGLLVGGISTLVAGFVGAFAGYYGRWVDKGLTWFVDLLLVLPSFLIIAVLSPIFRNASWLIFVVLLAAFSWMITARVVRSMTLTLKDREFVKAAKYMGVPGPVIIFRHILPNMASLLIIDTVIQVGAAVIGESGLSFFGFGVQAPDVSLGTIIADNTTNAPTFQWLFYFPATCLVLIGVAVAFIGDGLRDAFDPNSSGAKSKGRRRKALAERNEAHRKATVAGGSRDVLGTS